MNYGHKLKNYCAAILCFGCGVLLQSITGQTQVIEEDHQWKVQGISVPATLLRPESAGKYPAIIFVAGSGPTDRNWNSPGLKGSNGSARLLAEGLSDLGMITIRYDKRVSGPLSIRKVNAKLLAGNLTMQGHVDELAGAYQVLKAHPNVDVSKILVFGHSEGTLHSLAYQVSHDKDDRFAGLILAGVLGRPVYEILKSQVGPQIEKFPDGRKLKTKIFKAIDDIRDGKTEVNLKGVPEVFRNVIESFLHKDGRPFIYEFLRAEPLEDFSKVDEPILVMIGKKDIQVKWNEDGKLLEDAVTPSQKVTFSYPKNANHVLKHYKKRIKSSSSDDLISGYNGEGTYLDPEAWEVIVNWLKANDWLMEK